MEEQQLEKAKADVVTVLAEKQLGLRCWVCERPVAGDGTDSIQLCEKCDKPGLSA